MQVKIGRNTSSEISVLLLLNFTIHALIDEVWQRYLSMIWAGEDAQSTTLLLYICHATEYTEEVCEELII
jgi:hypothetical protein